MKYHVWKLEDKMKYHVWKIDKDTGYGIISMLLLSATNNTSSTQDLKDALMKRMESDAIKQGDKSVKLLFVEKINQNVFSVLNQFMDTVDEAFFMQGEKVKPKKEDL